MAEKNAKMALSIGHRSVFPGLMLDEIVVGIANNREPGIRCDPDPNSSMIAQELYQLPWNPIESMKICESPMTSYGLFHPIPTSKDETFFH